MGVVSIPKAWMGQTMQEATVKAALRSLNPDLHFDMGTCLNIWHPYQQSRQNVFYRGRSIGAMDRGTLPEVPIWTTKREMIEVPWTEVAPNELALFVTAGVMVECLKCRNRLDMQFRPVGSFGCPFLCGNIGDAADAALFAWTNRYTGKAQVFRKVRDRVVLVGWRHTFAKLIGAGVPGIDKAALEAAFGVNLDPRVIDDVQIEEDIERSVLDRRVEVA